MSFSDCIYPTSNVLAPKERHPEDPYVALNWYFNIHIMEILSFEDVTLASEGRDEGVQHDFKTSLKLEYSQPDDGYLFDMATGMRLRHSVVVASHIFQHRWKKQLSKFTSFTDINDVRNGLLLYTPVDWAFDRAKICVEVDAESKMTFRLLDQSLGGINLADKARSLRMERGGSDDDLIGNEAEIKTTFGDLNGQPLKFPEGVVSRPSKRMLGFHAVTARMFAQSQTTERLRPIVYNTSNDESLWRI